MSQDQFIERWLDKWAAATGTTVGQLCVDYGHDCINYEAAGPMLMSWGDYACEPIEVWLAPSIRPVVQGCEAGARQ